MSCEETKALASRFWLEDMPYEEIKQIQERCPHCGKPEPLATNLEIFLMKRTIEYLMKIVSN